MPNGERHATDVLTNDTGRARPAEIPAAGPRSAPALPAWPVAVLFGGLPLWWAAGVLDVITIPFGVLAFWLLGRADQVRLPRGFGWWLFFCAWVAASVVMLVQPSGLLTFGYRWLLYAAAGVLFVYVFNAGATLTARRLSGWLTLWFAYMTVGGYLGLLIPTAVVRTPLSHLLPGGLTSNALVDQMVVRRFAQYNPDGFLEVSPRPTAPFLYTNNWGSVYALLVPFVVVYILHTRSELRGRLAAGVLLLSVIPAFLTLNRGMFVSLGVAGPISASAPSWRAAGGPWRSWPRSGWPASCSSTCSPSANGSGCASTRPPRRPATTPGSRSTRSR